MQLLCHLYQVLFRNKSLIVLINILKNSLNILDCIILAWLLCHQLHKLLKTDLTSIIRIKHWHSDVYKCSSWLVASILSDGLSQIQWCQHTIMIVIQKVKHLLVYFNVAYSALSYDEFFWIEVDNFLWLSETWSGFLFRRAILELWYSERTFSTAKLLRMSIRTHLVVLIRKKLVLDTKIVSSKCL